jgi:hypothetical protein
VLTEFSRNSGQALSMQEQSIRTADLCGVDKTALRRLLEIYQPPLAAASA